jgi:anthranilate synthase component 1
MLRMTANELSHYAAQGYNRVAITRRVLADLDTPLSAYLKLAAKPFSYLLESVEGGEKWGRYSIIGLPARTVIRAIKNEISISYDGQVTERAGSSDPYLFVREFLGRFKVPVDDEMSRFAGGLVGYFGYDTVRYVEPKLANSAPRETLLTPDICLMLSDEFVVFDNLKGEIQFVCYVDPADPDAVASADAKLVSLTEQLNRPIPIPSDNSIATDNRKPEFTSEFGHDEFVNCVDKIKQYIVDGDVMQVVLAQRLSTEINASPMDIYRALRHLNPSPYLYYMDMGDFHIVGSSPEILVRLEDDTITTRPLAGTRPRGRNEKEDQLLEQELLNDPKELAEHLMLIDLGRNDVGKVAAVGSVKVTEKMVIEKYSNVMHISSNIEGLLAPGKDAIDVLRATLPVGTLSGAPKIRAMEIIDELEPVKRGVYGGAVGYISWNGNMDTAIAIRTAIIKNGKLYIQAGCGIVADSVPQLEWEETMNKGRGMFRAVEMAERGLRYELDVPES